MKKAFDERQQELKELFTEARTPEAKYEKIIQLGQQLPPFEEALKTSQNLVPGCQSQMFLISHCSEGKVFFQAWSDALISAGLAYLLLSAYSGLSPAIILKEPPKFLEDLGLFSVLSPIRSNGLKSLYIKMQQSALCYYSEN